MNSDLKQKYRKTVISIKIFYVLGICLLSYYTFEDLLEVSHNLYLMVATATFTVIFIFFRSAADLIGDIIELTRPLHHKLLVKPIYDRYSLDSVQIILNQNNVKPGDTVNGYLRIAVPRPLNKNSKFRVIGYEIIDIEVGINRVKNLFFWYNFDPLFQLQQKRMFFYEDLRPYLKDDPIMDIGSNKVLNTGNVPFKFVIPYNLMESYDGICVDVLYAIEYIERRNWKIDYYKKQMFTIRSSKCTTQREQKKIYMLNSKYVAITLENGTDYCIGDIIRGNLNLKFTKSRKILEINIRLRSIEYVTSYTRITKHELRHEVENYLISKLDNPSSISTKLSFEFKIPPKIKRSYTGKYSAYLWQLEVRIDYRYRGVNTFKNLSSILIQIN